MASTVDAKLDTRSRARGLTVATNLPMNGTLYKNNNGMHFPEVATAPSHVLEFDLTDQPPKRELSEALLNNDWRHKWRPQNNSAAGVPVLAPKKTQAPTHEKTSKKKLRIDTSATKVYNPRRYRDENDTPIDPDFILSAPATKQEYNFAESEDDEQGDSHGGPHDGNTAACIGAADATKISLGPKQLVRLSALTPAIHNSVESYRRIFTNKRSPDVSDEDTIWSSGVSAATAITTSDRSDNTLFDVQYPLAEMREVKHAKNLQRKDWSDIDPCVLNAIRRLGSARTEQPSGGVRRQNHEQAKEAAAAHAILDDPAIQHMQVNGQRRAGISSPEKPKKEAEKAGFEAMLAKLQAASAKRLATHDPAILDLKPSSEFNGNRKSTNTQPEEPMKRRASNDSGVSGIGGMSPAKASTLNPKAIEFNCPVNRHKQPATVDFGSPTKPNRPSIVGFFDPPANVPTIEDYMAVVQRMKQMEAEMHQLATTQRQATEAQIEKLAQQLKQMPVFKGPPDHDPVMALGQGCQHPLPGQGLMPRPAFTSALPNTALGFSAPGHGQNRPNPVSLPIPGFGVHSGHMIPIAPPGYAQAGANGGQMQPVPSGHLNNYPQVPAPGFPGSLASGATAGPAITPIWVHKNFGPKPVQKPKGPFRPGDLVQAKKQQEYEAYLEYLRSTNTEFHKECKARQNRRVERANSGRVVSANSTGGRKENTPV